MHRPGMLSIWFFIGALLLAYGIIILGAGIVSLNSPPVSANGLSELPPINPAAAEVVRSFGVWWGALLTVLGAIYTFKFAPGKGK